MVATAASRRWFVQSSSTDELLSRGWGPFEQRRWIGNSLRRRSSRLRRDSSASAKTTEPTPGQGSVWGRAGTVEPQSMIELPLEEVEKELVPEGLPVSFKLESQWSTVGKFQLLHRPVTQNVINRLQDLQNSAFTIEDGRPKPSMIKPSCTGAGASSALLGVVMWARLNGWLVVYIPDFCALSGLRGEHFKIVKSTRFPGQYDLPSAAAELCRQQLAAHPEMLAALPIKNQITLPDFQGTTLADLLKHGVDKYDQSQGVDNTISEVLYYYRMELNRVTKFPVLLAIDSFNAITAHSGFVDPAQVKYDTFSDVRKVHEFMPASRLTTVSLFASEGVRDGLVNGTSVYALSQRNLKAKVFQDCLKKFPAHLFPVEPYSYPEFSIVFTRYAQIAQEDPEDRAEAIKPNQIPQSLISYAYTLTSGNPGALIHYRSNTLGVIGGTAEKTIRPAY